MFLFCSFYKKMRFLLYILQTTCYNSIRWIDKEELYQKSNLLPLNRKDRPFLIFQSFSPLSVLPALYKKKGD